MTRRTGTMERECAQAWQRARLRRGFGPWGALVRRGRPEAGSEEATGQARDRRSAGRPRRGRRLDGWALLGALHGLFGDLHG
jgi:hypothetical protein